MNTTRLEYEVEIPINAQVLMFKKSFIIYGTTRMPTNQKYFNSAQENILTSLCFPKNITFTMCFHYQIPLRLCFIPPKQITEEDNKSTGYIIIAKPQVKTPKTYP